jgi:large conductance mechanosensitive channel
MLKEFKAFAMKGNILDLAVAVILGNAFGKIVTSLVESILMPLIGAILGGINFSGLSVNMGEAVIAYGVFIQAVFDFIIISFSIFLFIRFINRLKSKTPEEKAPAIPSQTDVYLKEIRDLLKDR